MNSLTLSGRLTTDPMLIDSHERPLCRMRIAVSNGCYPTTYIDVSTFGQHAYACAEYMRKGRRVAVTGTLAYSE